MCDDQDTLKKYFLSENQDSYIFLESGRCEYVDDDGKRVIETYGINNYWYKFLEYLIKHNGIKISFEQLYEYVYGYNPYDSVSDDRESDNDDPIKKCREQLKDFYMKIHNPKKRDKVKFYKYVKNRGFSLIKDGDFYCVVLPRQVGNESVKRGRFDDEIRQIKIPKIRELLVERAKKNAENLFGELEMFFIDENNDQIKGYELLKELLLSSKDNFIIGGDGGVGKSYLLQKLFCENINEDAPILIYVKLNDINTCTRKESYSVIQNLLITRYGRTFWDDLVDIIEHSNNETNQPVLLLDGFNEIGNRDRNALVDDYFLSNFRIVLSTRSDEGVLEKFDFHKIRIDDISNEEFESTLRQNGILGDYFYVPRTPLFIKLLLSTGKLNLSFGKLQMNDGSVECILHNYILFEIEKALSGIRMNSNVKRIDVAVATYVIIPYLAYTMTSRNIYSVSDNQIREIISELVVPEKNLKFSTAEENDRYSASRSLILGVASENSTIKQLNISDIGEEVASNKILFEITCNLISDKNILLIKSTMDQIGEYDIYSFFHQTIQEYLAQLFIYEVVSAEIILGEILFDKPININNLSYMFNLFSRKQIYRLHKMVQCNDEYLDYRIGLLRTVWNSDIMGEQFNYGGFDLSKTKEPIVKYDLLEGIDILKNAKLGFLNYDFNSLFGREEGRATAILYVSQSENGIVTLSDDGIIRTWMVSSDGIKCTNSKRTVFYFKNMIVHLDFYPRNFIEIIEMNRGFIDNSELLRTVSEALIIRGDDFNLFVNNNQLFLFDGMHLYEISDFCDCFNIARGFLQNGRLCIQNRKNEIVVWDEVDIHTVCGRYSDNPKEKLRFSMDKGDLLAFLPVGKDEYYFVVQDRQNIIIYMYDNGQMNVKEFSKVLKETDIIENEVILNVIDVICLCSENGSLICIFVDIEKNIYIRRIDDVHDCRVTSLFLNGYDIEDRNYLYLCSCDIGGNIIISHIIENREGLLRIDSRDLFNYEGLARKQIIPFWYYYEEYEKINNANNKAVFFKTSQNLEKNISNNVAPIVVFSNKWHIFNGCLYNYKRNMECETIPQNVRVIGKYAFANSRIKSLKIPDSVEIIEDHAFENSDIEIINFPQSIVYIGDYAFSKCSNLKELSFVGEELHLGKECFSNSGVKRIYFGKEIIFVGNGCFYNCLNLEQLIIDNCIGELDKSSFLGCKNLNSIELGSGLVEIGDGVFRNCSSLEIVQIPETVKYLGKSVFAGCDNLKKALLLNDSRDVSLSLFEECYGLEIIVVSNQVERIYDIVYEKNLCFDSGIMFASVCSLAPDLTVKIMNKHFYDTEMLEKNLYDIMCKNNRMDLFEDEIQKRMPKSDATFLTVYYHNPTWAKYMLDKGFDFATLAKVFYNAICEANIELVEILLSGIKDIYFIEKFDCFSIYIAMDTMFRKGGDTISVVKCLTKNGLTISETIVEVILAMGAPDVLDFFLKYLFEINYFSGIQNFIEKIEYLIEMNKARKVVDFESADICYIIEHLNDTNELEYQKFLSDNLDLRDKIGVRNWDNNTVLTAIRERYIKYYKI